MLQGTSNCVQNQKLNATDESRLDMNEENTNEIVQGANMSVRSLQDTRLLSETLAKSDERLQGVEKEIRNYAKDLTEAIDNEGDYMFNLAMMKITRADYTNLTTRICMELNNSENAEEDNPFYEFCNEVDFSNELENLDNLSEKYREAVNIVSKMQIGFRFLSYFSFHFV